MYSRIFKIVTLLVLLLLPGVADAQPYFWENYTSQKEITSLQVAAGYVWATSTGGVARIDVDRGEVTAYINSDGLGSVASSFSAYADGGTIYFGSRDGYLSALDLSDETFSVHQLSGRDGRALKLVAADTSGDFLWIATDVGVVKFDRFRHGGEVKETYRTLGSFPSETDVFDLIVQGDSIYAATGRGLASAAHANQFLLDPAEWINIASGESGLNADSVYVLEWFAGSLFAGTNNGLFRRTQSGAYQSYALLAGWKILDMAPGQDMLEIVADSTWLVVSGTDVDTLNMRRLYQYEPSPIDAITLEIEESDLPQGVSAVIKVPRLVLGTENQGLYLRAAGSDTLEPLLLPGPASNDLVGGGITSDGTIYTVERARTYSRYADGVWEDSVINSNSLRTNAAALVDSYDNLWVGSDGSGVFRVSSDRQITRFQLSNSALLGNNQDPPSSYNFIFVNDIAEDLAGRLWFSCRNADTNRVAVSFSPSDSVWSYFDRQDGIIADESRSIAAGDGYVAIGDRDQALTFIDYGSDYLDHSDDITGIYGSSRRLPSNSVTAQVVDRDNMLWVGTNLGLAYFDSDIKFFFPVELPDDVSNDIRSLAVDSRNNLWVGTSNGLAFISFGQTEKKAFTTENSLLISDDIRQLHFDPHTGQLLIFTGGGLSILDYNLDAGGTESSVYAYPNPFVIRDPLEQPLRFRISQRATVRIFNVAGEMVRKISQTDFNSGWDGTNDYGQLVASGIYIFELVAEDESRHTGKIFVLRR